MTPAEITLEVTSSSRSTNETTHAGSTAAATAPAPFSMSLIANVSRPDLVTADVAPSPVRFPASVFRLIMDAFWLSVGRIWGLESRVHGGATTSTVRENADGEAQDQGQHNCERKGVGADVFPSLYLRLQAVRVLTSLYAKHTRPIVIIKACQISPLLLWDRTRTVLVFVLCDLECLYQRLVLP